MKKRQFENLKLVSEDVAEMEYRPVACRKTYRLIIVRKNLLRRDEQGELFPNYRYFFYLTNDRTATPAQIVFSANDRCDQENLNAQLKGGVPHARGDWPSPLLSGHAAARVSAAQESRAHPLASPRTITLPPSQPHS